MRKRLTVTKTRKKVSTDDDLRHKRFEIRLIDGPLAGTYYVNNIQVYLCLPYVSRAEFLSHSQAAYDAVTWLYYKNAGSQTSKHKKQGPEYCFITYAMQPIIPTVGNPYSCLIDAARAAWRRGEFRLFADPF